MSQDALGQLKTARARWPFPDASVIVPYVKNDTTLFPHHEFVRPALIMTDDGKEEFFIWDIIDE